MITALYIRENSVYKQLTPDHYDITRNSLTWKGGNSIIAHPPCRAWGKLKQFAKPRQNEKQLAIHAIIMARLWGGIVEHPASSQLWKTMNITPGQTDQYGGWILSINQSWFGHRAEKRTYLYIVGIQPKQIPTYPLSLNRPELTIENMGKAEREHTPIELAKWLIKTAQLCNGHQKLLT